MNEKIHLIESPSKTEQEDGTFESTALSKSLDLFEKLETQFKQVLRDKI